MGAKCAGKLRRRERGQTMVLVAVSLVSLLAMAALAIDVVTLYVARGQAQRAADAAAIEGAKVLADAGVTTDPTDSSSPSIWFSACTLATQRATAVAQQNLVAGQTPTVSAVTFANAPSSCGGSPVCTFCINPQVAVTLQVSGLPTFFSKIWSRAANTVGATAIAEAFNPSTSTIPIAPRCVKPLLLPNCDPDHGGGACPGATYVNTTTGAITNPGNSSFSGIIGERFNLIPCSDNSPPCSTSTPLAGNYYPVSIPSTFGTLVCPGNCSVALPSANGFENELACCNWSPLECGQTVSLDTSDPDPGGSTGPAATGGQCLIHEISPGDQDLLDMSLNPYAIKAGAGNPLIGKTSAGTLAAGDAISTSDSVVSLPIYDQTVGFSSNTATVIGFLQVFVNQVQNDSTGTITVTVLNVAGCGSSASGNPISGAGPAIPVRLIHN